MAIGLIAGSVSAVGGLGTIFYPTTLAAGTEHIIVVALRTTTDSVASITDTKSNAYALRDTITNGTVSRLELWSSNLATGVTTADSFTITKNGTGKATASFGGYSGVAARGITAKQTGTSTAPTVPLTTQDSNNWVAVGFGWQGLATVSAVPAGNFRTSGVTSGGAGSSNESSELNDNTAAAPGSVTNTLTLSASSSWTAVALELRSTLGVMPPLLGTHLRPPEPSTLVRL